MIKILELFGGIGACTKAFERLGIPHEIADYVEIDKFAVKSFNAIHGTNFEPQDVTEWDKDIEVDLIMHGSPCQDFSVAGKQAGGDEGSGTRSSLMYETLRIVKKLKPKYVIWENVKNVISKKHWHNFANYQEAMADLGYINTWKVLNAKDYGVPQNRERVFTVSIREDIDWADFEMPKPQKLDKKLKDILEDKVDEKYYLSNEKIEMISKWKCYEKPLDNVKNKDDVIGTLTTRCGADCGGMKLVSDPFIVASRGRGKDNHQELEPRKDGVTNTITTVQKDNYVAGIPHYSKESIKRIKNNIVKGEVVNTITANAMQSINHNNCALIKTANKQGYDLAEDGDSIDLAYPNSTTRRGRVGHGVSKTIMTGDSMGTLEGMRIRKLTPKECWRLMGFDDEDFDKAAQVNSNAQLYKQAGNSIVVDVLQHILSNLLNKR